MVSLQVPATRRSLSHIRTTDGCWLLGRRHLRDKTDRQVGSETGREKDAQADRQVTHQTICFGGVVFLVSTSLNLSCKAESHWLSLICHLAPSPLGSD